MNIIEGHSAAIRTNGRRQYRARHGWAGQRLVAASPQTPLITPQRQQWLSEVVIRALTGLNPLIQKGSNNFGFFEVHEIGAV